MTTADFLRMVWPAQGYYTLATPFTPKGSTKPVYAHKVFETVDAAVTAAEKIKHETDVYFCIHSLAEPRVWNATKTDWKTGEPGAYEIRTQRNMLLGRALFFDIDVGDKDGKYQSQAAALAGLKAFVQATGVPKPFVSSSGGGLHVFWPLESAVASNEDWLVYANKLKRLALHYNLLVDPSRTTDTASVLRVPGTFNLKDRENPRPVQLLTSSSPTDNQEMMRLLDAALIRADLPTATPLRRAAPIVDLLGSNTQIQSGPPVGFPALVEACAQVRHITMLKGNVSEPLWYAMLGLVRYCEDGHKAAHYISRGHPDYDYDATEGKLLQLESKMVGPTTCEKIASVNPGGCDTCPRKTTIKSPLSAARQTEPAPAPVVPPPIELSGIPEIEIPPPPAPFIRLKSGAIGMETADKKDPDARHTLILLPYDFHPMRRRIDDSRGVETHIWRANLPRVGYTEIEIDADALYDSRKLSTTLSNKGVFPQGEDSLKLLRLYMVAYINTLQTATDAEMVQSTLGWTDDYKAFVLPTKVLHTDGRVTAANLSIGAQRSTEAVLKSGSVDKQIELLHFFDNPQYAANQFCICAALAAPIYHATGHYGVVINMSGKPGASKSTTLYTGASLWGEPIKYCLNGTNDGATHKARNNRMYVTANLPQLVDEITLMPPKDAADMAMGVTQATGRIRLHMDGTERKSLGGNKSTIMLSTANTSLYSVLSSERADSTAESMRVFEIQFLLTNIHKKHQADEFMVALRENYGHIGEVFMSYVVQHHDEVTEKVRSVMRAIDTAADIQASERFWSAAAAASLVACEIANKLGLLSYNPRTLWSWLMDHQFPSMRGTMVEHYTSPINVLTSYLESINGNILVLKRGAIRGHENISNVIRGPEHGQLTARHELDLGLMWILKKAFKDHCMRSGHNYTRIIDELTHSKVITEKNSRKVLGGGTDLAKGQAWCFTVDILHPDVSGVAGIQRSEADVVSLARARALQPNEATATSAK